jgi:hypothetical protein
MVPVRKPGRPLSACPHPRDQPCGCGSVTAAIPRKQTCHCGDDTPPAQGARPQTVPRATEQIATEPPSPSKVTFKVQKSSGPPSSRKLSFDPANFERMDMNNVNIIPFEQRPQITAAPLSTGYAMAGPGQVYGFAPQMHPQYGQVPMQPPPHPHIVDGPALHRGESNGLGGQVSPPQNGLEIVAESPMTTPTAFKHENSSKANNGVSSCCAPPPRTIISSEAQETTNGSSCCGQKRHTCSLSDTSLSSEPQESQLGRCCSSKGQQTLKREPLSNGRTPMNTTPHIPHRTLPQNGMAFNPGLYPQYLPQTTIFTYPASYGSFQNPLRPFAWMHSVPANPYVPAQMPLGPGALPFDVPLVPGTMDTIHTCHCGDTCQCVGCAAHPYNDATQDYVRSAWSSMSLEQSGETYTNGQPAANGNGNGSIQVQPQNGDTVASPTAHTPSSTTSGNGEEQNLSAADFFFVNYPFTSDGCGGDTQSCPCGDDCQCLGCTIHRGPAMPCGGEKDTCPCGDSCECIGCSIHNGGSVV